MRDRCHGSSYWVGRYWEGRIPPARQLEALLSALADMLTRQARYEEAEKLLRRLLDDGVYKDQAVYGLAAVLRKMGRADEANEIESDAMTELYRTWRGD